MLWNCHFAYVSDGDGPQGCKSPWSRALVVDLPDGYEGKEREALRLLVRRVVGVVALGARHSGLVRGRLVLGVVLVLG